MKLSPHHLACLQLVFRHRAPPETSSSPCPVPVVYDVGTCTYRIVRVVKNTSWIFMEWRNSWYWNYFTRYPRIFFTRRRTVKPFPGVVFYVISQAEIKHSCVRYCISTWFTLRCGVFSGFSRYCLKSV